MTTKRFFRLSRAFYFLTLIVVFFRKLHAGTGVTTSLFDGLITSAKFFILVWVIRFVFLAISGIFNTIHREAQWRRIDREGQR